MSSKKLHKVEKNKTEFGNRLKSLKKTGEMEKDFAFRLGIKPQRLSDYYYRKAPPSRDVLLKIARNAGVSIEWLLTGVWDKRYMEWLDEQGGLDAYQLKAGIVKPEEKEKKDLSEFAGRLAGLMADRNMSASDLAHIIGIDRRVVSNWLRGKNWPRDETMRKLAKLFGVSRWELVAGGGVPEPKELIFMGPSKEALGVDKGGGAGPDEKDERIKKLLTDMERDDSLREKMLDYYEYLKSRAEKSGKTREDKGGKE